MKKFLSMLIVLVMVLSLAGCGSATNSGNTNQSSAANDSTSAANNAATAEELPPYQIEYLMLTNSVSAELPKVIDEVNKITLEKFNATVNITMLTWGDWFTKVNAMLSSGEKADVVFTADWYQYQTSIANNYFLPLNDLLAEYGSEMVAQLGEVFIKGSQYDGINYGVPTDKELAVNGGFLWNKTLADKYNMTIDPNWKSYKDWEPLLEVIKQNEPNIIPLLTDGANYHLNYINYLPCDLFFNGNNPNDPTLFFCWDDAEYVNTLRDIRDLYNKEYIPKDSISADNDFINKHLAQGDFFLTTQPLKPGKGKSMELMAAATNKSVVYDEFETYPLLVNTTHCGGSMLAIPTTSEDPERAMMFINEMHVNPDLTNLLAWGVEGVTYTVASENPKRVTPIEGNSWTGSVLVWTLGNVFNVYLSDVEPADKYDLLAATKSGVPGHIANGYRFDTDPYLDIITAVGNVKTEYDKAIRVGALDTDQGVADLKAACDAAGFQQIKEAVTADFTEWINNK